MSLVSYPPAVYTIINDDGNTREVTVDNNPVKVYRKTMITIIPKINFLVPSNFLETNVFEVNRIGNGYFDVIGNTTMQT